MPDIALVTGASGFVGSAVARALVARGFDVRVLMRASASRDNIAGICSKGRNVLGLMPHPERACEDALGSSDGRAVFHSLVGALAAAA